MDVNCKFCDHRVLANGCNCDKMFAGGKSSQGSINSTLLAVLGLRSLK